MSDLGYMIAHETGKRMLRWALGILAAGILIGVVIGGLL